MIRSQKITVSFWPVPRYTVSITLEMFFFVISWLQTSNGTFGERGRRSPIRARPGVVSWIWLIGLSFSSTVL